MTAVNRMVNKWNKTQTNSSKSRKVLKVKKLPRNSQEKENCSKENERKN